jgi:DNA-binding NarL/FixJ family response regulator
MHATDVPTVLIAVIDQLRRTRIKHTLDQAEKVNLIGDSVNLTALMQQCQNRQPNVVVLDFSVSEADHLDIADQIRSRSPNTKIMLLDQLCKTSELLQWASKGILAYATSDTDGPSLELAFASIQNNSIWIGAQLTTRVEKPNEAPRQQAAALPESNMMSMLSEREKEVLRLLVAGHKNFAIAEALAISPETIKSHMRRIMEKMAVRDRTQLVIKVLQQQGAA